MGLMGLWTGRFGSRWKRARKKLKILVLKLSEVPNIQPYKTFVQNKSRKIIKGSPSLTPSSRGNPLPWRQRGLPSSTVSRSLLQEVKTGRSIMHNSWSKTATVVVSWVNAHWIDLNQLNLVHWGRKTSASNLLPDSEHRKTDWVVLKCSRMKILCSWMRRRHLPLQRH